MLISGLFALALVLAEAPAAASPTAPVAAAPTPAPVDPVIAEINALMAAYKGRLGDTLRGRLGLSSGSRTASDGEAVYWMMSIQQETTCAVDMASGAMRCMRGDPAECRLAVGFDKQGKVIMWSVTGSPPACQGYIGLLKGR